MYSHSRFIVMYMVIFLSLGSNLGDVYENLAISRRLLLAAGVEIVAASSEIRTKAWGIADQPEFLNQVLSVKFAEDFTGERDPYTLLHICQSVERALAKVMPGDAGYVKWGPRIIDIDILKYADVVSSDPELTLPHHTFEKDYVKKLMEEVSG